MGGTRVVVKFGFLFNLPDMAYFGVCHTAQVSTTIPTNQLLPHCKKSSSRQKAPRKTHRCASGPKGRLKRWSGTSRQAHSCSSSPDCEEGGGGSVEASEESG